MIWSIINSENIVVNTISWDGESPWSSPEGTHVINVTDIESAAIGSTYDPVVQTFTPPPPSIEEVNLTDPSIQTEPVVL
jgi:hypothetical protein